MTRLVPLGEVAAINPNTPISIGPDDLCSFVPMEVVDEASAEIIRLPTRPYKEVAKGYTSFAENDVLLAKITPCMENGKCAIARGLRNGIGFGSTEFHIVRGTPQILPEWIYYYWRLPSTRELAERNMTGTAGQKRVLFNFLESLPIPVPPINKQRDLSHLLEVADGLRRTRRYAIQLCDEFVPSTFLEMFGDLPSNAKGPLSFARLPSDLASMRLLCSGSAALSTAQARPRNTMTPPQVASGAGRKKGYREHDLTHLVSDGHQQVGMIVSAIGPQLSNHMTSVVERGRNII
jgi:hypothetical protein